MTLLFILLAIYIFSGFVIGCMWLDEEGCEVLEGCTLSFKFMNLLIILLIAPTLWIIGYMRGRRKRGKKNENCL